MFRLFEIVADRVREQAAEYAGVQARIGARALTHLIDPFGLMPARIAPLPAPAPEPAGGLQPRPPGRHLRVARRPAARLARRFHASAGKSRP